MQCVYAVPKTHYFPHNGHYCSSSMLCLSETRWFLLHSSFWEARCALIGQLFSALWLAEYLKRETEMLCTLPYCNAVSRRDKTKTIKPSLNEAFVASSEDIITDYNDSYSVLRIANKHCSTLPKTHTWIVSSKFFKNRNVLTDCESEAPDCPCDVGIAPLYSVHRHS